ncbi:zinc-binding alcohol dehydrogenase family protein [Luteimicrobium xylanilyticum]|uniref:NADPH:quinone reductase n=1 Tax=Luteimicrobium xylanilyticum TaxID=1133546 RepID=A0A5P9Q903_9MICO|nr:zinc-binding alcohol dehydrogenase family protein [Luteimicrobium xylanilyticum]QFU97911.1 NADPH:quinone reductase [Luteimicrobium xylanilyticum]
MLAAVVTGPRVGPVAASFPDPPAAEGRELVTLVAAGLHPVVRQLAAGEHYGSTDARPSVPGVDAVARTADGALVYTGFTAHPYGTFAERLAVPMSFPLPDGTDPLQAAAALNPGMASWLPLREAARRGPLGTVLVVGATGVAGSLAVRNALALGAAHVVAVGRDTAALDVAVDGGRGAVTAVPLSSVRDDDVRTLTDALAERRPGLVLDFLWGAPAESVLDALTGSGLDEDEHRTEYVEIGQAAGPRASVPAALLRSTALTLRGSGAGSGSVQEVLAEIPVYLGRLADGSVHVDVEAYPLERVADAWGATSRGRRVVVTGPAYDGPR